MTDTAHTESAVEWGFAARALPGETVSGDRHLVQPCSSGFLVAVVDGLGHGLEATTAASTAVATLASHAGDPLPALVKRCHEALLKTRGVTMAVASIKIRNGTMSWLGIGTVEGCLVRADGTVARPREAL